MPTRVDGELAKKKKNFQLYGNNYKKINVANVPMELLFAGTVKLGNESSS